MYEIAASDAPKWVAAVKEMTERAKELGPSPLKRGEAQEVDVSGLPESRVEA